jgi:pyruvate dehydrogenase E2 component (dihydrolipoamide acetyltransferase)
MQGWLKKEGDEVKSGDMLAEVETDKATMELESYEDGTFYILVSKEGDSVEVNGVIAVIGEKGCGFQKLLEGSQAKGRRIQFESQQKSKKKKRLKGKKKRRKDAERGAKSTNRQLLPKMEESKHPHLAKKMANDKGIDISVW